MINKKNNNRTFYFKNWGYMGIIFHELYFFL